MRNLWFLLLFLFIHSSFLYAFNPGDSGNGSYIPPKGPLDNLKGEQCRAKELHEVSNMPPQRDQGAKGFCYAFSAATIIDHNICEEKKIKCDKQEHQVAVLDLLKQVNDSKLTERGNGFLLYNRIVKLNINSLVKESCAPYNAVKSSTSDSLKASEEAWSLLEKKYQKPWVDQNNLCDLKSGIDEIYKQTALATDQLQIMRALFSQETDRYLAEITIPKECQNSKIEIPKMTISSFNSIDRSDYKNQLYNQLSSNFKKNQPMIFDFFLNLNDEVGHSTVIYASRKYCCKDDPQTPETCEFQYRIRDSARVISDKPGDYWVNSDFVERVGSEYSTKQTVNINGKLQESSFYTFELTDQDPIIFNEK